MIKTPCPQCAHQTLRIVEQLVAVPLGSFSLSGAQLKFSARSQPALTCDECDFNVVGRVTDDYIEFGLGGTK